MVGIFHFSPTLHIFSTRRFILKSPTTLASRIFFRVTKFQLLGAYMVATPSCHLALPVWSNQVKQLRVNCGQEYFFSKSFCKILVTNFWSCLSQEWVGDSTVPWNLKYLFGTWLRHWLNNSSIWTTPAMDWVAIDSQPSDLRAVPTIACFFNKSFLLCKRVRPRNHSLLPSVSVVSLSQCWGTLDFLL